MTCRPSDTPGPEPGGHAAGRVAAAELCAAAITTFFSQLGRRCAVVKPQVDDGVR